MGGAVENWRKKFGLGCNSYVSGSHFFEKVAPGFESGEGAAFVACFAAVSSNSQKSIYRNVLVLLS